MGILDGGDRVESLELHRLVTLTLLRKQEMHIPIEEPTKGDEVVTNGGGGHVMTQLLVVDGDLCGLEVVRDLLLFGDKLRFFLQDLEDKVLVLTDYDEVELVEELYGHD